MKKLQILWLSCLLLVLQGCGSLHQGSGGGADAVVSRAELMAMGRSQATVLLVLDQGLLTRTINKPAESFGGSACTIQFALMPEFYARAFDSLAAVFSRVDIGPVGTDYSAYDLVVLPELRDLKWKSTSPTSDVVSIDAAFLVVKGAQPVTTVQWASNRASHWHNGCNDAMLNTGKAAVLAVDQAANTLARNLLLQGVAATAGPIAVPPQQSQEALRAIAMLRTHPASLEGRQSFPMLASTMDAFSQIYASQGKQGEALYLQEMSNALKGQPMSANMGYAAGALAGANLNSVDGMLNLSSALYGASGKHDQAMQLAQLAELSRQLNPAHTAAVTPPTGGAGLADRAAKKLRQRQYSC